MSNFNLYDQLIQDHLFHKLIPLVLGDLKKNQNPRLHAYLAQGYLFTGQEEKALESICKAPNEPEYVSTIQHLWNHFNARALMAKRTGKQDAQGAKLLKKIESLGVPAPELTSIELSAVMIVKNEEEFLAKCLESIRPFVDEIIVIDTGSTDRTVEIAKSFGAVIAQFEWCNSFAAARNEALRLATKPWALWIDADESVPGESVQAFREGLMRPQFCGFNVPIWNFVSETQAADQFVHTPTRLFRLLPGAEFSGRIHESITDSLLVHGLPVINLGNAAIHHFGYTPKRMIERNKLERNQELLEAEIEENPHDSFQWFNLGNNLSLLGRLAESEYALKTSLKFGKETSPHRLVSQFTLLQVLGLQRKFHEVCDLCDSIVESGTDDLVLDFERANALMQLGRFEEALESIEACLTKEWVVSRTGDYSIYIYKKYVTYGQILAHVERYDEAIAQLEKALSVAPDCGIAAYSIAQIYVSKEETDEAMKMLTNWYDHPEVGDMCQELGARILVSEEKWLEAGKLYQKLWNVHSDNHELWIRWVACAEQSGNVNQILEAYEAYSKQGGQPDSQVLVNWGRALEISGEVDRALTCFSEAMKRDPDNANAYFNCGDLLYKSGHFADAAHVYESGLRLQPTHAEGWFVLGNALANMNLIDGACLAYRQAIALNPYFDDAKHNLEVLTSPAA